MNSPVKVGFLNRQGSLFSEIHFMSKKFNFYSIDAARIGFDLSFPNNYSLPEIESPDIFLLDSTFYSAIERLNDTETGLLFERLRKLSKLGKIVVADGRDQFALNYPPKIYAHADVILKTNGVFKDKELYNYTSGALSPSKLWGQKVELKPPAERYSNAILDKIKLSYPCMLALVPRVRAKARAVLGFTKKDRLTRYAGDMALQATTRVLNRLNLPRAAKLPLFIGALNHIQRLEMIELLTQSNVQGHYKIAGAKKNMIWGTEYGKQKLPDAVVEQIYGRANELSLTSPKLSKAAYMLLLRKYLFILSPVGYGELCFRHGEAWQNQRVLVCQDLSHVEMMLPIVHNENALSCKSDFSDLPKLIRDAQAGKYNLRAIQAEGYNRWTSFVRDLDSVLYEGFEKHVLEIL